MTMTPTEAMRDFERAMQAVNLTFGATREAIDKLRRDAENFRPRNPLAGVKFAQGGYVGGGEPIKGRLFLHDHDGHTCEIVGAGAHYPVISADEVRRLGPKLLDDINDRR